MNLSGLADPESPQARVAAVAVLGAMLVGGCSLAGSENLSNTAANAAAQVAEEQRTAEVRQAVQCDLAEPTTLLSRPASAEPHAAPSAGTAAPAATPEGALEDGLDLLPDLTYKARAIDTRTHLFTSTHRGKVRAAVTVAREGKKWIWDSAAWCDQAELPASSDAASPVFVWTNSSGGRVSTRSVHTVRFDRATQECYGELVAIVVVDGIRYVFDPLHSFTGTTYGKYRDGVRIPATARDTGLSSEGATLWRTEGQDYVYLVDGANRIRLPREKSAPAGVC